MEGSDGVIVSKLSRKLAAFGLLPLAAESTIGAYVVP
jgi:hypothetical protein